MESVLKIENINFWHNKLQKTISNLSLSIQQGHIGCLLGPSGCGKTTLLRLICGFEQVSTGEIRINNKLVCDKRFIIPTSKRDIGIVFQDSALFGNMTIEENISFGLHRLSKIEAKKRVNEMISAFDLKKFKDRFPHEISQGQQQRVAIARTLAPQPSLLLMDEPFANLDAALKLTLTADLREILKEKKITALVVTHDQHEAFAIADEIGVMSEGKIQQWGSPYELYHKPDNQFIADFVGEGVLVKAKVISEDELSLEDQIFKSKSVTSMAIGTGVDVLLRPDDVEFDPKSDFKAEVTRAMFRGPHILYTLKTAQGNILQALIESHHNYAKGEKIGIKIHNQEVVVFDR